jgi:hypothetical protein
MEDRNSRLFLLATNICFNHYLYYNLNLFPIFQTSPMRFYYRIYQKTKVLTRKRKKKRTRATSGPHQPAAKKLRTLDLTALAWNGGSGSETTTASPAIGRSSSGGAAEAVSRMETDTTALPPTTAAATAVGASAALPAGSAAVSKSPEKGGGRPAEKAGASGDKRQPPATAADKTAAISDVRKPVKSVVPSAPAGGNKVTAAKPPVAAAVKGGKPEAPTSVSVAPPAAAKSVTATAAMGNKAPAPQVSGAAGGTKQGPAQVGSEVAAKAPTTAARPVPPAAAANKPAASVVKKPIVAADKGRESAGKVNKSSSSEAVLGDGDGVRKGDKPVVQANGGHTTAAETAASKKADQDNTVSKVTGQSQQQQVNSNSSSSNSNRGGDKTPSKLAVAEKKKSVAASPRPRDGKEVVEISVEVSASDVKKVLEKKRAEKDAAARLLLPAAGEERLYSNYSIVDQIKKAGTAASLARQQTERASMMDFARTSEALASAPRVPPILQGLQPRLPPPTTTAATEPPATTVLSAIVQNLAQKQQKAVSDAAAARASPLSVAALVKDTPAAAETSAPAAGGKPLLSSEYAAAAAAAAAAKRTSPKPGAATDAATAKTLGAIVAPALSTAKGMLATTTAAAATPTTAAAAASSVAALAPKLPGSTSIQAVSRDGKASPTAVETSGPAGQQMLSFYKSSFAKAAAASGGGGLSEAVKSAESLTKNIPAGTTVTVKTIENKSGGSGGGKTTPPSLSATPPTVPSPAPPPPSSPKNSAFRMNLSGSTTFHTGGSSSSSKTIANPYASMAAVSQASLINPFVHSTLRDSMTMALAAQQAQFLNFSNHQPFVGAAAALAAQMEAANFANNAVNYVRAAQQAAAAQRSSQSSAPMTTLEFTKAAASLSGHLADDRYGVLKIPQPGGRSSNPSGGGSLSSFGTNRLQVKVNSDEGSRKSGSPPSAPYQVPATTSSSDSSSPSQLMANGKHVGTHSMPAILPFHGVKKVQALPKTASHSSPRPVVGISSVMGGGNGGKSPLQQQQSSPPASPLAFPKASPAVANAPGSPLLNTIQSLTDSNPFTSSGPSPAATTAANSNNKNGGHPVFSSIQSFKAPPSSVGSVVSTAHSNMFNKSTNVNSGGQQPPPPAANNSLKKLAADLNTAQQKTLKGDNVILNALKKSGGSNGGKLSAGSDFGGKGFGGKVGGGSEVKKVGETGGGGRKEVTTSS